MNNLQLNPMLADAIPAMSQQDLFKTNNFKVEAQVFSTMDYNLFKILNGNRDVNRVHVERLKQSFTKHYLFNPILINNNFEIIDGQHRFEAAKSLGLRIYFILTNYGLKETQIFNTNTKNWRKEDYLDGYCKNGNVNYITFRSFMNEFPDFTITGIETILSNLWGGDKQTTFNGKKADARTFENGEFKVYDINYSYEVIYKIIDYKNFYPQYSQTLFVRTLTTLFKNKNYNHGKMITKLSIPNKFKLEPQTTQENYLTLLENIYNYRSQDKISLKY